MDYRRINLASWNDRVPAHVGSSDYGVQRFGIDPTYLSGVVRFDQPLLGDVSGLTGVHLQCHIGTDTVSLARLGASMTGLDFSEPAVAAARDLAASAGTDADFVVADVYDAVSALQGRTFDLVYTGIGALCWLPSVSRWAAVVAQLLAPGGRLFIREGHPALWAVDYDIPDRVVLDFPYFEMPDALVEVDEGTYVATDHTFDNNLTHTWNHGLGETVQALLDQGLVITGLAEHQSVPWLAMPEQMTEVDGGEFVLTERPERLPLTYTLQARKRRGDDVEPV